MSNKVNSPVKKISDLKKKPVRKAKEYYTVESDDKILNIIINIEERYTHAAIFTISLCAFICGLALAVTGTLPDIIALF